MENHVHQYTHHNGVTTHSIDGEQASIGIKGLFGGKTFFGSGGHLIGHSEPTLHGGTNIYQGQNLNPIAKLVHTPDGFADANHPGHDGLHILKIGNSTVGTHDGNTVYVSHDLGHGFHSVMSFGDPLLHLSSYSMPPLHL